MYLSPDLVCFRNPAIASGVGVHADEADAALDALVGRIDEEALERLQRQAMPPLEKRSNPPSDPADEEGFDGTIMPTPSLFPLAFLITGRWGAEPSALYRETDLRPNPPVLTRDRRPFEERLAELGSTATSLRDLAMARYRQRHNELIASLRTQATSHRGAKARELAAAAAKMAATPPNATWVTAFDKVLHAIDFVLQQMRAPVGRRSILDRPAGEGGMPFGARWEVIGERGNQKLPFVAYSEFPMATCPGAGACRVPMEERSRRALREKGQGWCYSFRALRYAFPTSRLLLNTLANEADREFSIRRAGGPAGLSSHRQNDVADFDAARARAALSGRGQSGDFVGRVWQQYVKGLCVRATRNPRKGTRRPARIAFVRLFVDGDVNHPDSLAEWMEAARDTEEGGRDIRPDERPMAWYGYSKSWRAFLDLDAYYKESGRSWPSNYTLNLSSGSVYGDHAAGDRGAEIRDAMLALPVTRGFFRAIPLDRYLPELERASDGKVRLPVLSEQSFAFSEARIREFLEINKVRTLAGMDEFYRRHPAFADGAPRLTIRVPSAPAVQRMLEGVVGVLDEEREGLAPVVILTDKLVKTTVEQQIRRFLVGEHLRRLLKNDESFRRAVRDEIARDERYADEAAFLEAMRRRALRRLESAVKGGKSASSEIFTEKALHDKATAMALHEVLMSLGAGGSCPLVCGNCSDRPEGASHPDSVHRCASRGAFQGRTISIGLH